MSQQFEYEFEQVETTRGLWGRRSTYYQEIIRRRAAEGWRFVDAFAPSVGWNGLAFKVDLIFERPVGGR